MSRSGAPPPTAVASSLPPPPATSLTLYQKQRDREAIRQATNSGYFFTPDKTFLAENCADERSGKRKNRSFLDDEEVWREKQLQTIKLVKLVGVHLRQLGDVTLCRRLRICRLGENHIQRLDGLQYCRQLLWLDVHSNQLTSLPGPGFWACLPHLLLLNLHDNPLGRLMELRAVSAAPSLLSLTLYDSPLSLHKHYRHHVVNSILTLKALDNYIISDEEVIEDAHFAGSRFQAGLNSFRIELCPWTGEDVTYHEEMGVLRHMLRYITTRLSKLSPVIIMQKCVRAFLCRARIRAYHRGRDWAASRIQQWWRRLKNEPEKATTPARVVRTPGSTERAASRSSVPRSKKSSPYNSRRTTPRLSRKSTPVQSVYITQLRCDSRAESTASGVVPPVTPQELIRQITQEDLLRVGESNEEPSITKRRNLLIDLSKLQAGTLQAMDDDAVAVETVMGHKTLEYFADGQHRALTLPPTRQRTRTRRKKKKAEPQRRVKSVKQFSAPRLPFGGDSDSEPEVESVPQVNFRLQLKDAEVEAEILVINREFGKQIRSAQADVHTRKLNSIPKVKVPKPYRSTEVKRTFGRTYATPDSSVHRADSTPSRTSLLKEDTALRRLDTEASNISMKRHSSMYSRKTPTDERQRTELDQKSMAADERVQSRVRFTGDESRLTNRQRTGDRSLRTGAKTRTGSRVRFTPADGLVTQEKTDSTRQITQLSLQSDHEQTELVRSYLEHRQHMQDFRHSAPMDTLTFAQASDRLLGARSRVEHLKARTRQIEMFSHMGGLPLLPSISRGDSMLVGDSQRPTANRLVLDSQRPTPNRLVLESQRPTSNRLILDSQRPTPNRLVLDQSQSQVLVLENAQPSPPKYPTMVA